MLACVIAFLTEETTDLVHQLRVILDAIDVVTNAADEESFADGEEEV